MRGPTRWFHHRGRDQTLEIGSQDVRVPVPRYLLSTCAVFRQARFLASAKAKSASVTLFCILTRADRTLPREEIAVQDFTVNELSGWGGELRTSMGEGRFSSIEDRLMTHLKSHTDAQGEVAFTHEHLARFLGAAGEVVPRRLVTRAQAVWI